MQKTGLSLLLSATLVSAAFASEAKLDKIIVTTPTKSPLPLASVTANVDVITAEEIEDRGFETVSDLLRTRAGLQMVRNGGWGKSTSIYLRGMDSKRTLVLIDGVRFNDPSSLSGAPYENLLLGDVARIEIVKGPQSGLWGADASAGVINIITKRAQKEGFLATVGAEYGSYNTQKYLFDTAYKSGKFDISLGFIRLDTDGFSAKVPEGRDADDFEDDGYTNNTATLRAGLNVSDRDRLEAFLTYIDADSDYDGYNSDPVAAADDDRSSVSSKDSLYGISYVRTDEQRRFKLYASRSEFKRDYATGFQKKYRGSVDEVGFNSDVSYEKFAGKLSAGIDYKKFREDDTIDDSFRNYGIFLTNANTFNALSAGKTIFSQLVRYDDFDAFDNRLTYKVGLKHIHEKIEGFWTAVNYATAYNVPTLYQLYSPYGNRNLNPEKTRGFDITANYRGFGVTYFQNDVDDLIEYKTTNFETFEGSYFNIDGTSRFKGVEVDYKGALEALSLAYGFNYTYLKAEDQEGKALPRRAKNTANLSLDYYGLPKSHFGAVVSYVGKRKKSMYDANPQRDYKSYTLVDLNADYRINDRFTLYGRVENALDKSYRLVTGYGTAARSFYAGFRYRLK